MVKVRPFKVVVKAASIKFISLAIFGLAAIL